MTPPCGARRPHHRLRTAPDRAVRRMRLSRAEQAHRVIRQSQNRLLQIMRTAGVTRALEQISEELRAAESTWSGRELVVSNPGYVVPATEATR